MEKWYRAAQSDPLWVLLAFALMTGGSKKQLRVLWLLGSALLAIVTAKLIFLDLSQTGTLTRVISFIASGAVMLLIGYIAPLPPNVKNAGEPKV